MWVSPSLPQNIQDDDAIDRWQIHYLAVDLQAQLLLQILDRLAAHDLAQAHLDVVALVA